MSLSLAWRLESERQSRHTLPNFGRRHRHLVRPVRPCQRSTARSQQGEGRSGECRHDRNSVPPINTCRAHQQGLELSNTFSSSVSAVIVCRLSGTRPSLRHPKKFGATRDSCNARTHRRPTSCPVNAGASALAASRGEIRFYRRSPNLIESLEGGAAEANPRSCLARWNAGSCASPIGDRPRSEKWHRAGFMS